ncbi:GNAT family protein [Nonomuraea sp. NPDC046570]|uniref:GNAT family N-acetyltransferase n=1 Tax=Nonomuraea sp. NPDC046570 TaxID=3155255 RepID=UPI003411A552
MTQALSTPPASPAGALAAAPQPVLPAAGGLLLRPWDMDFDDGIAACAYWVLPAARGTGVASRALTAVSAWALEEIGFHRLELDHSTRNHASCRVAAKAGFLLEGTKRSAAVHGDGRHDMHYTPASRGTGHSPDLRGQGSSPSA